MLYRSMFYIFFSHICKLRRCWFCECLPPPPSFWTWLFLEQCSTLNSGCPSWWIPMVFSKNRTRVLVIPSPKPYHYTMASTKSFTEREKIDEAAWNALQLYINVCVCCHASHKGFACTLLARKKSVRYFLNKRRTLTLRFHIPSLHPTVNTLAIKFKQINKLFITVNSPVDPSLWLWQNISKFWFFGFCFF